MTISVLRFETRREAAAFVAALSRFLNSPRSKETASHARVWVGPDASGAPVHLYLSSDAMAATADAFAPVPAGIKLAGVPAGAVLLIEGGTTPALGIEEAERRLTLQPG